MDGKLERLGLPPARAGQVRSPPWVQEHLETFLGAALVQQILAGDHARLAVVVERHDRLVRGSAPRERVACAADEWASVRRRDARSSGRFDVGPIPPGRHVLEV